jgi:hypothetical protein
VAERDVLHREAEEPGEADGLAGGVGGLEGPAEDLGAHVDAERRLDPGALLDRAREGRVGLGAGGDLGDEPLLPGLLVGRLEDEIDGQIAPRGLVRAGRDAGARRCPRVLCPRPDEGLEEDHLPREPDGEHLGERGVGPAVELALPEAAAGEGGPPADGADQGDR